MNALYFNLQQFKAERAWHNLNPVEEAIADLLCRRDWYRLLIPQQELEFDSFRKVRRWQEIAAALYEYCERYYTHERRAGKRTISSSELTPEDPNFVHEYQ